MIAHYSPISGIDTFGERLVATAGYDNQIILWNAATRTSIARGVHDHLVNQCQFSSCGKFLVSASSDYSARVWSVPDMRLRCALLGHDDDVEMASFDSTRSRVATASRDHRCRIFDLNGQLQHTLEGHTRDVLSVAWIKNDRELLSSSDDGTVRRWSTSSGRLLETIDFEGVETDTIAVCANGCIYSGNDQGLITCINSGVRQTYDAHVAGIKRLVHNDRNSLLLSCSYDRTVKLWSCGPAGRLDLLCSFDVPANVWLRSCAFDGTSRAVFGTFGETYAVLDLNTGAWNIDVGTTPGLNAVWSRDETTYCVGDAGVVIRNSTPHAELGSSCNFIGGFSDLVVTGGQLGLLFDANTGRVLHEHWSPLNCSATFERDGAPMLVVGTYTGEGLIFRKDSDGLHLFKTLRLFDNAVKGLAANESTIFSVSANRAAAFHSIRDLALIRHVSEAHERICNGAAALPDGRFASVSRDRKLKIWDVGADSVVSVETPHDHSIKCVAASPQSGLIATGAYDGTVAIFDVEQNRWIFTSRPTISGISSLTSTSDPFKFLASSYDGKTYTICSGER